MVKYQKAFLMASFSLLLQCSTRKIDRQTYDQVSVIPDSVRISNGNLTVYNVYKAQVKSLYSEMNRAADEIGKNLVDSVYKPYKPMWEGYLGDETSFIKWNRDNLNVGNLNKKASAASKGNLDELIQSTCEKMTSLSGHRAYGRWYIAFGPAWTDLGGIGNGIMVIDLATPNTNKERITYVLPHELNHQIYGSTSSNDPLRETVLFRCVDEGFATYVNQLYWSEKGAAKSLLYSESDLKWCRDNEKELFNEAKKYFLSTEREDKNLLAARSKKLVSGGPGAQGYYIGYRICEEYVKKNGADSWKMIYDLPVSKLLELSGL